MSQYGGGWQQPQWGPQRWPQQQWAQRTPHPGAYYGSGWQQPRSRGNGCATGCGVVALVGAVLIVAGLFVVGVIASAFDETSGGTTVTTSSPRTPSSSTSRPTRTPSPTRTPTPTETPSPTPTRTTSSPTPTKTSEPTRTSSAPTPPPTKKVSYKNDDYKVPAANEAPPQIPFVAASDARAVLQKNALYSVSLAEPVRCEQGEIDGPSASDAELKRYFEGQMACSMRVWAPALAETNTYKAYRPTVTIYGRQLSTPCGEFTYPNAFYCSANQQLYLSRELARAYSRRGSLEVIMAHEYAHHVQGRIGIWGAFAQFYQSESQLSERNELKRRSELQADCLAGMYARSVAVSRNLGDREADAMLDTMYSQADDVNKVPVEKWEHGTGQARRAWLGQGLKSSSIGRCNTWTAPSNQVR